MTTAIIDIGRRKISPSTSTFFGERRGGVGTLFVEGGGEGGGCTFQISKKLPYLKMYY